MISDLGDPQPGRSLSLRRIAFAIVALYLLSFAQVSPAGASPMRLSALGAQSWLVFDVTNLQQHPSLARTFAHADVELFDEWAGAVVPIGTSGAVGLFLNRPTPSIGRLNDYTATTGSRAFRSLVSTPWLDGVASMRLGGSTDVGVALRAAYDRSHRGAAEASTSLRQALIGLSFGAGKSRGLDVTVRLDHVAFRDRDEGFSASETDGTGLGVEVRGRWQLQSGLYTIPWISWEQSKAGLAPESRTLTALQSGLGINARPNASTLVVAGLLLGVDEEEVIDATGVVRRHRVVQMPTTVGGIEVQAGAMSIRVGIRHRAGWVQRTVEGVTAESFSTHLVSHVGVGFRFGDVAVDGLLRKQILRDGPYLLTGDADEGGLFTNLSLTYFLFD